MLNFKFGSKFIGLSHKPLIIAEVGINHLGNISLCKKMIKAAAHAGADVVKLQTINVDESYMSNTLSYKVFKDKNFSKEQLNSLYTYAKKHCVELFSTPGDLSSLKKIKSLKFPGIKISSGLMNNLPLIQEAIKYSKPIIISTGMAYDNELRKVINLLKKQNYKKYVILQCTAKYPNEDKDVNLQSMKYIRDKYKCLVGYSDHTLDDLACVNAVALGATVIEKHFTTDNTLPGADNSISMIPENFKKMVLLIDRTISQLGKYELKPTEFEKEERTGRHRYFVAKNNIKKGSIFSIKNLDMKRLNKFEKGISTIYYDKVLNKVAKKNVEKNQIINLDLVM